MTKQFRYRKCCLQILIETGKNISAFQKRSKQKLLKASKYTIGKYVWREFTKENNFMAVFRYFKSNIDYTHHILAGIKHLWNSCQYSTMWNGSMVAQASQNIPMCITEKVCCQHYDLPWWIRKTWLPVSCLQYTGHNRWSDKKQSTAICLILFFIAAKAKKTWLLLCIKMENEFAGKI